MLTSIVSNLTRRTALATVSVARSATPVPLARTLFSKPSAATNARAAGTTPAANGGTPPPPPPPPESYPNALKWLHWGVAATAGLGCVGTIQIRRQLVDKDDKEMHGLLMTIPAPLPGSAVERLGADLSHKALYVLVSGMAVSGVTMGYFGGKGLPFFGWTIPGTDAPRKSLAKNAYWLHSNAGQALTYLLPLHIAGSAFHFFRGQAIFARINPFA
ncbi:uncharacterized protein AMSG_05330 [Thecamonas trahens ATCC 50062]|uniref:Cytochrome b561 bacterial/Ni-hydrogenase domain-containing protein n=1 Tax=Thecamonas trahens ATCC 50062 TaxID=461836 RepID=A0A0L0DB50_THETB|nr:hypothetical protein AMSG_05330 [Thecamonas trahens ATCC 50062]KNC49331.1 hypothetical protein AMSG_05330 [Thecamonas trahens ATCC 50062]|eukprot:XP_013758039.1 hypothetical protein AMSG_05330 [Thecamonas trahens ATCC 50062]